jgi:hypothetical protein
MTSRQVSSAIATEAQEPRGSGAFWTHGSQREGSIVLHAAHDHVGHRHLGRPARPDSVAQTRAVRYEVHLDDGFAGDAERVLALMPSY